MDQPSSKSWPAVVQQLQRRMPAQLPSCQQTVPGPRASLQCWQGRSLSPQEWQRWQPNNPNSFRLTVRAQLSKGWQPQLRHQPKSSAAVQRRVSSQQPRQTCRQRRAQQRQSPQNSCKHLPLGLHQSCPSGSRTDMAVVIMRGLVHPLHPITRSRRARQLEQLRRPAASPRPRLRCGKAQTSRQQPQAVTAPPQPLIAVRVYQRSVPVPLTWVHPQ
mmetsp:Transcript_1326/g.3960  ORF Transcript_1326/g.3960 Transcript_1326/m.3960 type:complete len:216 (-) Transcript_1326:3220-3867(-)